MNTKHTSGPWAARELDVYSLAENRLVASVHWSGSLNEAVDEANARLIAAAPELLVYALCEDARSRGEDIAETVLKKYGFDPAKCTATEFVDGLRRAAIASVKDAA